MYDKAAIGNRIKQSREAMKMTQDELADTTLQVAR